jgi:Uma2 family endonuclease
MSSVSHVLTVEEALALPPDPFEEIINGEVRKMPPPEKGHSRLITVLARLLLKQLPEDQFEVVTTAYGLGIRREPVVTVRIPDLTVFDSDELRTEYRESQGKGYVWIAPRLVVECLSPSKRKGSIYQLLADYESAGAFEVWLIEPKRRLLTRYALTDGELVAGDSASEGSVSAAFAPIEVDMGRLWEAFETGR